MASTSSNVFVFTANSLKEKTSTSSTSYFQSLSRGMQSCAQAGSLLTPKDLRRSSRIIQEFSFAPSRRTTLAEFEDLGDDGFSFRWTPGKRTSLAEFENICVGTSFDEEEDVPDLAETDALSSVEPDVLVDTSLKEKMSRWVKFDDSDENSGDPEEELALLVLKNGNLEDSNLKEIDEQPAFGYYHNQYDEEEVPGLEPILINPLAANSRWSPVLSWHGVGLVHENALEAADHFGEHTLLNASLFDEDSNSLVHNAIMPDRLQSVWPLPYVSSADITGDLQQNLHSFRFTSHMSSSSSFGENFTTPPEKQDVLGLAVASNAFATPTVSLAIGQQASAAEMPNNLTNERACFAEGPDRLGRPKIGLTYDTSADFIDREVKEKTAAAKNDNNIVEFRSEASHVTMLASSQVDTKTRQSLPSRTVIMLKEKIDRISNKSHSVVVGAASPALLPAPVTSHVVVSPNQSPEDFDPGGKSGEANQGGKFLEKAYFAPRLKKNIISSRAPNDATAHAEGAGRSNSAAVKYSQNRRQSANYGVSEANLIKCEFKECFTRTGRMQQQLSASKEFMHTKRIHERSLELNWAFYKQYGTYSSCRPQKISKMKDFQYWCGRKNFHCKEIGMPFQEGLS